jgi:preprotein translocase subunit SecG
MLTIVTIFFMLIAVLLIGVVLVQQPKTSGGLFSGTGQSLLGTSGKTFWTKFTTILAAVFMCLCLLMAILIKYQQPKSLITDLLEKQQPQTAPQAPASSTAPMPAQVAPQPQAKPAPQSVPGADKAPAPSDSIKK